MQNVLRLNVRKWIRNWRIVLHVVRNSGSSGITQGENGISMDSYAESVGVLIT